MPKKKHSRKLHPSAQRGPFRPRLAISQVRPIGKAGALLDAWVCYDPNCVHP